MADLNLRSDEKIILEDGDVSESGLSGSLLFSDDLYLTNYNLIYVYVGLFGKVKNIKKYSLEDIKIDENEEPMAYRDWNEDADSVELRVELRSKTLEVLFSEDTEENVEMWVDAIKTAVEDLPGKERKKEAKKDTEETKEIKEEAAPKPEENVKFVSKDCLGCGMLITGGEGKLVVCEYCDTKQAL